MPFWIWGKSGSSEGVQVPAPEAAVNVNRRHVTRDVGRGPRLSQPSVAAGGAQDPDVESQRRTSAARDLAGSARSGGQARPSLENCGFARAMMKQMPSKLALSASKIANVAYGKSRSETLSSRDVSRLASSGVRQAPSLIRYEKDVTKLVDIIESELQAQGLSILTEKRKITRLRELPVSLTVKRLVRQRLEEDLVRRQELEPHTRLEEVTYRLGRALVLTKRYLAEVHGLVHIWHDQLKAIEGNFGQHVGLYFRFMRWLLVVNMEVLFVSFLFLVVPQMVLSSYDPDEARRSAQGMGGPHHRLAALSRPTASFSPVDLLTGQGSLLTTPMYYGFYYRDTIQVSGSSTYHMPSAYLNITTLCITIQLIMLARSTARSYRTNFIDVSNDKSGSTANLILAGWDSRVTSAQLAQLKRDGLYAAYLKKLKKKELAAEAAATVEDEAAAAQRRRQQLYTVLGRLASNLLVLAVLSSVSALTWVVMEMSTTIKRGHLSRLASAFLISTSMALFPMLFQLLGLLEKFKQQRALMFITLIRMVLMVIIILSTIIIYWVHEVNSRASHKTSHKRCWEDEVGSELYQLMIVDLFFMLFFETGLEYARKVLFRWGVLWVGEPHFDIPRSTMFLIYGQTLVWVGTYFSPLLSLIGCLRLVITFYVRKWSMEHNCQPQSRSVRASQTQTVFRVVAFIVCFLAACFTGYIVLNVRPSETCGPFQGRSAPWVVVNDTLNKWRDDGHTVIYGLAIWSHRPGVVAVWILVFSVVAYYLRSLAQARQEMIELLRGQLMLEGQDKVTLLQMIDDAASKLDEMKKGRHRMDFDEEEEEEEEQEQTSFRVLVEPSEAGAANAGNTTERKNGADGAADKEKNGVGSTPGKKETKAREKSKLAEPTEEDAEKDTPGTTLLPRIGQPAPHRDSKNRGQMMVKKREQTKATKRSFWSRLGYFVAESSDEETDTDSNVSGEVLVTSRPSSA